MSNVNEDVHLPLPTAPVAGATAVLYDSTADPGTGTTASRKGFGARFRRCKVSVRANQDTAASGYVYAESDDGGTTWITVSSETMSGGTDYSRDHAVGRRDFKVSWTASGTGPTTWRGSVVLVRGDRASTS